MASRKHHNQDAAQRRRAAGEAAESQMAFYLHRALGDEPGVHILNNRRFVDPHQPEHNGAPGVCQIDHLVVHRRGMFIVESKSATGVVTVRDDGHGGDEWTRRYQGKEHGFPSPIKQANRQADFLRTLLNRHCESLLGKAPTGIRTLAKIINGTDQRGFRFMPIQIIVAISDSGVIRRIGGWKEPSEPFQIFVTKADSTPEKIRAELRRHTPSLSLLVNPDSDYGVWHMLPEETTRVVAFLESQHTPRVANTPAVEASPPRSEAPKAQTTERTTLPAPDGPACGSCGGIDLAAQWGRYGYYWRCGSCAKTTTMPTTCAICGAIGSRGKIVRIHKKGPKYFRHCEPCGIDELIWAER
ncbi:MAG: NERD domain-containing protein [Phycisphaerales bacterium]|nr:MAG: NERD domain-containing protein [Phycisphaerales bacterium]